MILKYIFDRLVSFIGLLFLWPVLFDCGHTGEGEDARRACVLRAKESR